MESDRFEVKFLFPNSENYSDSSFSGQVFLKCKINNIMEVTETDFFVTPSAMIRGLPFVLTVTRIGKKDTIDKTVLKYDALRFSLVVNEGFKGKWNCHISCWFRANDAQTNRQFEKKISAMLNDTWTSLYHDISFDHIAGLGTFMFNVIVVAGIPSNWSSVKATKYIGLRNEGATCYINSVLQSLFQITRFREIVFDAPFDEDDVDFSFIFALKYIFYLMQNIRLPEVRTKKLIDLFNWKQMTTSAQQDVHEFVRRLIEELKKYLDGTKYANSLSELFAGQLKKTTDCGGIQNTRFEVFWDLTLSVHENADIQEAIESYLKPEEVKDYGENQYAILKQEFTVLPPVLCVSLLRFGYDVEKQQIYKINKLFKFDANLDLSKYIPNSSYTLHSVLVHSGTFNFGHYIVFTNPKCDNSWYKFDDKMVTKCLESCAIERNFGNCGNTGNSNAYMLIYIKNVDIPFVFNSCDRPIPIADTIEAVIKRDQQMIESMQHQFEFIVYTPERMCSIEFKRDGKLFETRNKHSFIKLFIDRSQSLQNLYDLLFESLCVSKDTTHIRVLRLSSKGAIDSWKKDRLNEGDQVVDPFTPLENLFSQSSNFLFIQMEPLVQKAQNDDFPESLDEKVMIFLKHYDANSNSITFFECSFFKAIDGMDKVYDYIREELQLDSNVLLKVYREGGRGILITEEQLVYSAILYDEDIGYVPSAPVITLVFEIGENEKSQYSAIVE